MCTDRRDFLRLSTGLAAATLLGGTIVRGETVESELTQQREIPESIRKLRPMTDGIKPITLDERKGRIEKARRLMKDNRIAAIYLEPGSSMFYFTGMRWGLSERMFGLVIPARGEIAWVCPKFEEAKARELIKIGEDFAPGKDESYRRVATFPPGVFDRLLEWKRGSVSSLRWVRKASPAFSVCRPSIRGLPHVQVPD